MAWSINGRNQRAEATAALIAEISLHGDDPGANGTENEVSGGGYSRGVPVFGAASGGVVGLDGAVGYTGPSEAPVEHAGLWDGSGNFLGSVPRAGGDGAFNAAGEFSIATFNIDADGSISAA